MPNFGELLVALIAICHWPLIVSAYIPAGLLCQRYCVVQWYSMLRLECCSFVEKFGECPPNNAPTYDHQLNLVGLHCIGDFNCPDGYKCCPEQGYPIFNLCKRIVYTNKVVELENNLPPVTTMATIIKESGTTGTSDGSDMDDDASESGSGSGSGWTDAEEEDSVESGNFGIMEPESDQGVGIDIPNKLDQESTTTLKYNVDFWFDDAH